MNEEIENLKDKKNFGYSDVVKMAGAAIVMLIKLHYNRIAEEEAYDALKNGLGFDDETIEWIQNDLKGIMAKTETEEKE